MIIVEFVIRENGRMIVVTFCGLLPICLMTQKACNRVGGH